jgi:c-di-GMP-related signal transduction protein
MMSLLPAMLRVPMEELAPALPLRDEIRESLKGAANRERILLSWVENRERGNWEACDTAVNDSGLDHEFLLACYAEALIWAEAALSSSA